jgi:hypothetical protein
MQACRELSVGRNHAENPTPIVSGTLRELKHAAVANLARDWGIRISTHRNFPRSGDLGYTNLGPALLIRLEILQRFPGRNSVRAGPCIDSLLHRGSGVVRSNLFQDVTRHHLNFRVFVTQ